VSFSAITPCVASQRVFIIVVVYFVIDSVRKLLDTPSYMENNFTHKEKLPEMPIDSTPYMTVYYYKGAFLSGSG
jgi:DNA-binding transcriptional regulator WhiA